MISDKGATALADALMCVTITPSEIFLHFIHFVCDNGIIMVLFFLFGSQNTSLTNLPLDYNQIGDAGAASIGGALAYVILLQRE